MRASAADRRTLCLLALTAATLHAGTGPAQSAGSPDSLPARTSAAVLPPVLLPAVNRGPGRARAQYERGQRLLDGSSATRASLLAAISSLQEAAALEPTFGSAHARLADAYRLAGIFGALPFHPAMESAGQAAHRAVTLEPDSADAHRALGAVLLQRDSLEAAEQAYRDAVNLAPGRSEARRGLVGVLLYTNRLALARVESDLAFRLDSLSFSGVASRLWVHFVTRDFAATAAVAEGLLRREPSQRYVAAMRAVALSRLGRHAEAIPAAEAWVRFEGTQDGTPAGIAESLGILAIVHAAAGNAVQAREAVQALRRSPAREASPVDFAAALAAVGEVDAALAALEGESVWTGTKRSRLLRDPRLDPLRDEPRFARLLDRLNLTRYAGAAPD